MRKITHKIIKEGGLSRLYSHIKDKDTFAIIGSQDKDTKEDRSAELRTLVHKLSRAGKIGGYNYIKGHYTHKDGTEGDEYSLIIYNIDKQTALDIGRALNQETILWKDDSFIGYIKTTNGTIDMSFDGGMSFDDAIIADIGASSQLTNKGWTLNKKLKNKNTPFVFESYLIIPSAHTGFVGEYLIDKYEYKGDIMELDESLFEDQERVVDDILQYKREIDSQTDLENAIANLEVGEEELVLRMRTAIPGLTDNDFDTLHIIKRTPEWYKMWLTDDDGNVANDNNFSTYDNTLYWATLAMQGGEQAEETTESIEESATSGKKLEEASTSRIYSHLTQDENWAIISPYNTDKYSRKQNQGRMNKLRAIVQKDYGLGYNQFLSKWVYEDEDGNTVSTDEESLLIPQMTKAQAMKLGKDFEQSTIIVNDKDGCREICTTAFGPYNVGDVVRTYDLSGNTPMNIEHAEEIFANKTVGPVSKAIKGGKPFHLSEVYKVELPRASYFQMEPTYTKIYERLDPTPDPIGEELEETKFLEEPTEEMVSKDYQNQLITLINGEWDTIQDYNELINNLIASANEKYLELVPIIEGIIKDEHNHIGNLHVALTKLNPESDLEIDKGGEEAEDILRSED